MKSSRAEPSRALASPGATYEEQLTETVYSIFLSKLSGQKGRETGKGPERQPCPLLKFESNRLAHLRIPSGSGIAGWMENIRCAGGNVTAN
jgi:hypothetical protein